ncbi:MAG TPA: ferritin-like domain-containing protein [Candidimonas sp.]|nr:ferritin-like domain-containing protein [Candidimonas sp.]
MTSANENLLDWLRDAHAMEMQAETMLDTTASRLENYPQLRARLQAHLEETREQARLVKTCIERLGGDTSGIKDMAAKATATAQGLSGMFVTDEVVKAAMASYTFEHMEIAAYRALIAAAETVGDLETRRVCEIILPQEEAMAAWLAEQLPIVTREFLERDEMPDTTAKH